MKEVVETLWLMVGGYVLLGLGFAGVFQVWGLVQLDSAARGAGLGFRLLITPGIAALWPFLAWRWWEHRRGRTFLGGVEQPVNPRQLRRLQRIAWQGLLVLFPLLFAAALIWRSSEIPPTPLPVSGSRGALILTP
jgi:hypothetical protein